MCSSDLSKPVVGKGGSAAAGLGASTGAGAEGAGTLTGSGAGGVEQALSKGPTQAASKTAALRDPRSAARAFMLAEVLRVRRETRQSIV